MMASRRLWALRIEHEGSGIQFDVTISVGGIDKTGLLPKSGQLALRQTGWQGTSGEMMNNAGRMTTTARRDIGACSLEPDRKAWVRGLRTDV